MHVFRNVFHVFRVKMHVFRNCLPRLPRLPCKLRMFQPFGQERHTSSPESHINSDRTAKSCAEWIFASHFPLHPCLSSLDFHLYVGVVAWVLFQNQILCPIKSCAQWTFAYHFSLDPCLSSLGFHFYGGVVALVLFLNHMMRPTKPCAQWTFAHSFPSSNRLVREAQSFNPVQNATSFFCFAPPGPPKSKVGNEEPSNYYLYKRSGKKGQLPGSQIWTWPLQTPQLPTKAVWLRRLMDSIKQH